MFLFYSEGQEIERGNKRAKILSVKLMKFLLKPQYSSQTLQAVG